MILFHLGGLGFTCAAQATAWNSSGLQKDFRVSLEGPSDQIIYTYRPHNDGYIRTDNLDPFGGVLRDRTFRH